MSEHTHKHEHTENGSCGCHDHDTHGHTHQHGTHDESCSCGCQDQHHDHGHEHTHEHTLATGEIGVIHVESHLHDEARVISGLVTLVGDEAVIKAVVREQLSMMARAVYELGGIVGHIKAACETKAVEMLSVTDFEVMAKASPEKEIRINLAAIVFIVDQDVAESLVQNAMQAIREAAGH